MFKEITANFNDIVTNLVSRFGYKYANLYSNGLELEKDDHSILLFKNGTEEMQQMIGLLPDVLEPDQKREDITETLIQAGLMCATYKI